MAQSDQVLRKLNSYLVDTVVLSPNSAAIKTFLTLFSKELESGTFRKKVHIEPVLAEPLNSVNNIPVDLSW
eukprot:CAMPEP_0116940406 /NCGR_PEP_ID=MMETSP0467-20121206/33345_1 /TAXON_ID=283647 /ORGANISM="Mesodinium pulex, Strain SPMC105" /LENGTH=70 /DNA_ID=CAMNT_0004622935 /DNA_START=170 /DNA_END=382 /DNA_ORIENTATION=+